MPADHLQNLNEPQLKAVRHVRGPILVLAGAGSGKTRVLTRRIVNLILEHRVAPYNILAVTFTNKATEEMRERLQAQLGERAQGLWVATFHSAALRMLRRFAHHLSYSNDFVVYDEDDARGVMKEIIKEMGIDEKRYPPQLFLKKIDGAKNNYLTPDQVGVKAGAYEDSLFRDVYDQYQKRLLRSNAMDFGDLLMNAVTLLERFPEVRTGYQNSIHYILVDEYQDTNVIQYKFLRFLAEPRHNLLVVGDDDQSIYAFRGATIRNILEFEKDFADTTVIKLEQNYRSSNTILEAANSVIAKNTGRKGKQLWTAREGGGPILTYLGSDENEEAFFIAKEIKAKISAGFKHRDIAIFYRTNAQSRAIEQALIDLQIPYRIYGGLKFYERKEIKDIIAYLRLILNETDDQALVRTINTPTRGIGGQTLQSIASLASEQNISLYRAAIQFASKHKQVKRFVDIIESLKTAAKKVSLGDLIRKTIEVTEYAARLEAIKDAPSLSRLENLRELEALGRSFGLQYTSHMEALREFLDRIALTAGNELPVEEEKDHQKDKNYKPDVVSLMTLHLAKGLEFPIVFLSGMEEGLLPHYKCMFEEPLVEEERRLCYVGITRAMEQLYITRSAKRGMFSAGDGMGMSGFFREASRFAFDIPAQFLSHCGQDFFSGVWDDFTYDDDDGVGDEEDDLLEEEPVDKEPKARKKSDIMDLVGTADRLASLGKK